MSDLVKLPSWYAPANVEEAKGAIYNLSRSMAENAYTIGKHLVWIKAHVGHGNFIRWIGENVHAFGERTVRNLMTFAERCDSAGLLEEYRPGRTATVAELPEAAGEIPPIHSVEWDSLRRELVALERELDSAATHAELMKIQRDGERLQARAMKLMRRAGQEASMLTGEMEAFFGFAPLPEDIPSIIRACHERTAELKSA